MALYPIFIRVVGTCRLTSRILRLSACALPCWIGIVPGKTTIGEAQTLIRTVYVPSDYDHAPEYNPYEAVSWLKVTHRKDGIWLSVSFNIDEPTSSRTENSIVSQITLYTGKVNDSTNHLTLGDWYGLLGEPESLSITWGNHVAHPNMLYPAQGVRLTFNMPNEFDVDNAYIAVGHLDVYSNMAYPSSFRIPWKGFRSSNKDDLPNLMLP